MPTETPFTIVALIDGPAMGDIFDMFAHISMAKKHIPNAQVTVLQTAKAGVQGELALLCPEIDYLITTSDTFTVDDLLSPHYSPNAPEILSGLIGTPDMVISPHMFSTVAPVNNGRLMETPDWFVGEASARLTGMGVDASRDYVCLHVREDGYRGGTRHPRGGTRHPRSVYDVTPYFQLIDHIIDEQGLQVIRIGDPSMQEFPERDGFFDLCNAENALLLHNFAIERCRFMIGVASGPAGCARQFNTPNALTNSFGPIARTSSVFLNVPKTYVLENGERLSSRQVKARGLDTEKSWRESGGHLIENSAEDLVCAASYLFDMTTDHVAWEPQPLASFPGKTIDDLFTHDQTIQEQSHVCFLEDIK